MRESTKYFINGIGIISPQKTFESDFFLTEITQYHQNVLRCVAPDFKLFINPIQMRRLSRMLRIGLSAAIICLRDANVKIPDGIITATGYGFLDETAKFLEELLRQSETQLTPTYFMQSTSNALAGLVALTIKCTGYNNTYVSKGYAFENAITDALVQISENASANLLVGAYDEAAEVQYIASARAMHYKTEYLDNLSLFESKTNGSIQGEGSAFFIISATSSATSWCELKAIKLIYNPVENELAESLASFLDENDLSEQEIDVLVSGVSGDIVHDVAITSLASLFFKETLHVRFKHLCGEYCTSGSFALWLGASILKKQQVPEIVKVQKEKSPTRLRTVFVFNQYLGKCFSFMILKQL